MEAIALPLSGLPKRLVDEGILIEEHAQDALSQANQSNTPFVAHLVANGLASSTDIALAASSHFGTPVLDLSAFDTELFPKDVVDIKLIRMHHTIPLFKRENRLYIAVSDPTNLRALDELTFHTGISTQAILVEEDKLSETIAKFLEQDEDQMLDLDGFDDADLDGLDIGATQEEEDKDDKSEEVDEAPIVRFINKVLLDAIKMGASDIHFEPYEKIYRVRFRTDGILHERTRPPQNIAARITVRLKVMSQMDISERRVPQDGRIKLKLTRTRSIDFRVNTLPTLWGEKIVLRILDPTSAQMGIDSLGYEPDQKELFMKALHRPQGMILVTGPTGSGKTVSLYTGLNILNNDERNISTAEDPVEINLEGINQVNMNYKVGLDFAEALRAFLRQDPDIIMVGEIRDIITAEVAIKAAQTGHLVLSTLHTNSAAETLTRLRNMGVPAFNIATSVSLIIAQRLARKLCEHCKEPVTIPEETLIEEGFHTEDLADLALYDAIGCDKCNKGYKGRVGIYEVVPISPELAKIIMSDGNSIQIAEQAHNVEGYNNLRQSGLLKIRQGITTLKEINRITKD
ncbi:MAG: type IV-A pilus assembly ATPase PilB [Pseudomonadales bacterium]|nr:type IV-A pilus assembly ATPase PilB [Pseudomonadales bacterium]